MQTNPRRGRHRPRLWLSPLLACLVACAPLACGGAGAGSGETSPDRILRVYAAASLIDVFTALQPELERVAGMPVAVTPGASGALARQIARGAPADLFVSASPEWIVALEADGRVAPGSSCDWLGNTLVCVVPVEAKWTPAGPADLASPGLETLALAIDTAPVGRYAREALRAAGVAPAARIVECLNARDTLAKIALGAADAGVVYRTDVALEPRVRIAFAFDPRTHAPIRYPVATLQGAGHPDEARAIAEFLCGGGGRAEIEALGFTLLSGSSDV